MASHFFLTLFLSYEHTLCDVIAYLLVEYQFSGTKGSKPILVAILLKKALLLLTCAKNFTEVPGKR